MAIPISRREKMLFALTIIMAITAMLYAYGIEPQFVKWQKISDELEIKEERLKNILKIIHEKDELKKKIVAFKEGMTPESAQEELANLLGEIEGMAERVHIRRIEPLPIEKGDLYQTLWVRIDIECGIEDLVRFLYKIQNSPWMLMVEKISIDLKDQDSSILEAQILVATIKLCSLKRI